MLSHLTALAVVGFSLWTLVFVGMPLAFHYQDKLRAATMKLADRAGLHRT